MSLHHTLARLWRTLRRRRHDDAILREEIAGHLSALEAEYRAAGLSPEDARDAARRQFGNEAIIREDVREEMSFGAAERLAQDVRYATRTLSTNAGFAAFTILTLALGIGATTAAFSLVNGVLLRRLPFADPDRLVMLEERFMPRFPRFEATIADFAAWQAQAKSFTGMAAFRNFDATLAGEDGRPERVVGKRISANLTSVLGVQPILGRAFRSDDDVNGGNAVALLGHGLWQRRFGGLSSVIGTTVRLNGVPYTIVGVMPPGFKFPQNAELWVPIRFTQKDLDPGNGNHNVWAVGRLRRGVTQAQALAELNIIMPRLRTPQYWSAQVVAFSDHYVGDVRSTLLVLFGAAGLLLLIACANVAGLMMARGSARSGEMALRVALGASRGRLVQQVLTEALVLAIAGALLGIGLGVVAIRAVKALPFMAVPRLDEVTLDYRVLFFAVAVTLATGLVFGLVPALRVSRDATLAAGARVSGSGSRTTFRNLLIASEVALALVLLTGAGLLVKSLSRLLDVRTGLEPHGVLTASINLPAVSYRETYQQTQFVDELVRRLQARPEIRGVAMTTGLPFSHVADVGVNTVDHTPFVSAASNRYRVTPDYWRVMGIPLLRGRVITAGDTPNSPPIIVINETLARRFFPDRDPIGKQLFVGGSNYTREIVGVVGDVRQESLRRQTEPQIYEAFAREPSTAFDIVVAGAGDPVALASVVGREVLAIDKGLPLANVIPMDDLVTGSVARDRLATALMGFFALVALLLAAVGIYGVIAYAVSQRTREIGIRAALGANGARIVSLVLGQSVRMVALGLAAGLVASLVLSRLLRDVLYDVGPRDPGTLIVVSTVLLAVAMIAALIPARRAVRVPPIAALRLD
jgi:putative ABC transport system permease protein